MTDDRLYEVESSWLGSRVQAWLSPEQIQAAERGDLDAAKQIVSAVKTACNRGGHYVPIAAIDFRDLTIR